MEPDCGFFSLLFRRPASGSSASRPLSSRYDARPSVRLSLALRAQIVFFHQVSSVLARCLPSGEAVAPENRQNLDKSLPLGAWEGEWRSAQLLTGLASILLNEVLGINTSIIRGTPSSSGAYHALAGCLEPALPNLPCRQAAARAQGPNKYHFALEVWSTTVSVDIPKLKAEAPDHVPISLGGMGFTGKEGAFVVGSVLRAAWGADGTAMEYYKSYNTSWHRPWLYYDGYRNIQDVLPCAEVEFFNRHDLMAQFLQHSGDEAGIERLAGSSSVRARCFDGSWWIAPACRERREECVPFVTGGGVGWGVHYIMQKAVEFKMPIAVGVAVNSTMYEMIPRSYKVMPYWWFPDTTFATLDMTYVVFPSYNQLEHNKGIFTTASDDVELNKLAVPELLKLAPDAYAVLSALQLTVSQVELLLRGHAASGRTVAESACQWVLAQRAIWENWIPNATKCQVGQGWVDGSGRYTSDYSSAESCSWCGAGWYSRPLTIAGSSTRAPARTNYVCELCAAGVYRDIPGETECNLCGMGQYTSAVGSTGCTRCGLGFYSDRIGGTQCTSCREAEEREAMAVSSSMPPHVSKAPLTTLFLAAQSARDCVCPNNTYYSRQFQGCVFCVEGQQCPGGFSPLNVSRSAANDSSPVTVQGYSAAVDPDYEEGRLLVFQCQHAALCLGTRPIFVDGHWSGEAVQCTGGAEGFGCGRCILGMAMVADHCTVCPTFEHSQIFLVWVCVVFATWVCTYSYYTSMFPPEPMQIAYGNLLGFIQAVAVVSAFTVEYPEVVKKYVCSWARICEFDLEVVGIPLDCVSGTFFLARYSRSLLWPVFLALGFFLTFLNSHIARKGTERVVGRKVATPCEFLPEEGSSWCCGRCVRALFLKLEHLTSSGPSKLCLSKRLVWFWPVQIVNMHNAMLKAHMGLFIVLTKCSMGILRFKKHPSEQLTLQRYVDVLKYSSLWWWALPLAGTGFVFYVLGFFAYAVYLVAVAPARFGKDTYFRTAHRGLWAKFAPGQWWFGLVQLTYAVMLNVVPVMTTSGKIQVLNASLINVVYAMILSHLRPWKFMLNHYSDLLTKIGLLTFILFAATLAVDDDTLSKGNTLGYLMLCAAFVPIGAVIAAIVAFVYCREVRVVDGLAERVRLAQRLHDIVLIAGAKSAVEMRAYSLTLLDNDKHYLEHVLDVLQWTMLGLQPCDSWKRRCLAVPYEFSVPGRLEGELIALDAVPGDDYRRLARRLHTAVERDILKLELQAASKERRHSSPLSSSSLQSNGASGLSSIARAASSAIHTAAHLKHTMMGVNCWVVELFRQLDEDGDGSISQDEFVKYVSESLTDTGESLTEEELRKFFMYIDADSSGRINMAELQQALIDIPSPVMPTWYTPKEDAAKEVDAKSACSPFDILTDAAPPQLTDGDGCLMLSREPELLTQADTAEPPPEDTRPDNIDMEDLGFVELERTGADLCLITADSAVVFTTSAPLEAESLAAEDSSDPWKGESWVVSSPVRDLRVIEEDEKDGSLAPRCGGPPGAKSDGCCGLATPGSCLRSNS